MATFHLSTRAQSRNLYGHKVNSLSHFQYITRSGRYTNKDEDLAYSESGNIPNCPELELDIKNYWKAANDYGRVNSRAYRDVVIALQEEFSLDENIALVHDFMHHFGMDENQTYSFAIHDHQSKLAPEHRNIHCHLMFNERIVNQERVFEHAEDIFKRANSPVSGGLKVDPYFNTREFVIDAREYWEKINNDMFIKKGLEARISCKTLKLQKAELEAEGRYEEAKYYDRKPMDHMGPEFKDPKVLQEIYERSLEKEKELTLKDNDDAAEDPVTPADDPDPWTAMRQAEQAEADAFETKKEMYAADLALRRAAKEYQLEKAKLNQKRYQRKLYQLKKFGFDETIATDPITVTVGDVCHQIEKIEAQYNVGIQKELDKVAAYREEKLKDPAQIRAYKWQKFEEVLANANESGSVIDKRNFTTYQKYKKLQAEIANLKAKEKAANANDLAGIQRECISKERDLKLIETERLYFSIQTENGKTTVGVKLSEIEQSDAFAAMDQEVKKHNQAREKWAREAERKAEQLSKTQKIYRVQREKLEKSMPESMLLYGEDIPAKVYLTAKVRGKPLMQMPFTNIKNDVYVIVKLPKEMTYGKPLTMACVKLGEATSKGMARIYKVNIVVTQERIGASGKVMPKYTALSAAPTNLGARLYPKYNPLLKNGANLTPLDLSADRGGHQKNPPKARALTKVQSKLEELVSKAAQNDTRSFGQIWDQGQTADAKTAQAKKNDPTKEMARVNNDLENGEWAEMMRQLYEASGIDIGREQGRSR
jgi:hypothetical protein